MGQKAEYKSAVRSRKMIRQAFTELMREKELEKITVTDIITRADLNRGTFYAHYPDTEAVLEQMENEIIDEMASFLEEFKYKNFFQNPLLLLLKIARYLEEDLELYRILINSRSAEQFLVNLKKLFVAHLKTDTDIPESIRKSPEFTIRAQFLAGGILNLYQVWFRGETNLTLSELSITVGKLITSSYALLHE